MTPVRLSSLIPRTLAEGWVSEVPWTTQGGERTKFRKDFELVGEMCQVHNNPDFCR